MDNTFPHQSNISPVQRRQQLQQEPRLIWFTGLSGSGKSTLAMRLEHHLFHLGYKVYLLDGDNLRQGLNSDLGFTKHDRAENIRRVSEVAKLMVDAGLVVICAFISPIKADREMVRAKVGEDKFSEIYVNCPLRVCEDRDTKGLYKKARKGTIPDFTGISSPYEAPDSPCLEIHTDQELVDESVYRLLNYVEPLLEVKNKPAAFELQQTIVSEPFMFIL